jgi:ElaA protein
MELTVKSFDELTASELYEILRVRAEVFVVEQNCIYNDLDGKDQGSIHVFITDGGSVVACLRVLPRGVYDENVRIGRVITTRRGLGLGARVLKAGLEVARDRLGADSVTISAQTHAIGFYEKSGFQTVSDVYMEDGIPHVRMVCKL